MKNKFPKKFLFGVATSSYQIEGDNFNSDWWKWPARNATHSVAGGEEESEVIENSGRACDYWNRWREDHQLLTNLGVNSFRLSLEWSRIEPKEGEFSQTAIQHYREILEDLKTRDIKTVVTLWHWVSPNWFQENYGLHKKKSREVFVNYGKKIIDELGDLIDVFVVINEPMMPLAFGFLNGKFPPGIKCPIKYWKASRNLSKAYKEIYNYSKEKRPKIPVGITMLYNLFEPNNKFNPIDQLIVWVAKKFWNESFFKRIRKQSDYYGLDYYFHRKLGLFGQTQQSHLKVNDVGWEIYPEGIKKALKEIWEKYELPIYIMENGLADANDKYRGQFIKDHLHHVSQAITDGVDVRGYLHWSLMDNYEWLHGYAPRFGLVEIDYTTLERIPRKSFYVYKKLIEESKEAEF